MIRLLTGQVALVTSESVVLDVSGVGYEVYLPVSDLRQAAIEKALTVHVYTHVREDALQLYGFSGDAERNLFVQLISVSGVGPKSALGVLDKGASEIIEAIQNSDIAFFKSVPRLGKKTAQKIILELQSKVGALQELSFGVQNQLTRDVRAALVNMGYDEQSIDDVVSQLDPDWDVKMALKWSLQHIGKGQ